MIRSHNGVNEHGDSHKYPSPFQEMFFLWRDEYVAKLREIHQLRFDARTLKTDTDQEIQTFLKALLEVLDTYDKMLSDIHHALTKEDKKAGRVVKSFQLLRKQFQGVLKQFGVSAMQMENAALVSGLHKAVGVVCTSEVPKGHVVRVKRQGYYWKNQVLRPAEVLVASSQEDHSEEQDV